MRLAIASDHAALTLKAELADYLRAAGHSVEDLGPHDAQSVDYPTMVINWAIRSPMAVPSLALPCAGQASVFRLPSTATPPAGARWYPNRFRRNLRANIMTPMSSPWERA